MSLLEHMEREYSEEEDTFWSWNSEYEVIESEMIDQRRWVTVFSDVIAHKDYPGEYVRATYEQGSTEYQDSTEPDAYFQKVVPKEVTVIQYVAPKE